MKKAPYSYILINIVPCSLEAKAFRLTKKEEGRKKRRERKGNRGREGRKGKKGKEGSLYPAPLDGKNFFPILDSAGAADITDIAADILLAEYEPLGRVHVVMPP